MASRWSVIAVLAVGFAVVGAQSAYAQCKDIAKAAKDVKFDKEVKASKGVVYLALAGGNSSKPNDCGLNPTNPGAEWAGWGGPLVEDNASIGEGPGTRNFITIGGVRYQRGIGTHSAAKFVYSMASGSYTKLSAVVGMDDEKDGGLAAPECGHGGSSDFIFSVDGKEMAKSGVQKGVDANKQVPGKLIEFAIPAGAKELTITITDGGDGASCDHADIGDPMLVLSSATAVEPVGKAAITWGTLKAN
ncbi:hypothetical protein FJZ36_12850 [Candidatus Poribacteria bacterium]|nr:hypothetical protein [Candidatus Poribacteria bacterium]